RPPLLDELVGRVELEQLRGGGTLGGAGVAAAREHEQVPFRVLRDPDGFADRVVGNRQRQHFLGDLQLRRRLFEGLLLGHRRLQLRRRAAALGQDHCAEQQHYQCDRGLFHTVLLSNTSRCTGEWREDSTLSPPCRQGSGRCYNPPQEGSRS